MLYVFSNFEVSINQGMITRRIYQVDAFASAIFKGNPAAVCPLTEWLRDELMLKIAQENNLSETAFYVKRCDGVYEIRWFTPTTEVDLCGHATLAAAFILLTEEGHTENVIDFFSPRSGFLRVRLGDGGWLKMNFPCDVFAEYRLTESLYSLFKNTKPNKVIKGKTDYLFVFDNEEQVKGLQLDLLAVSKLDARGIIASARGEGVDFVSRFFAPQVGVDEDPVTGSAHTLLIPYWSEILNKRELIAYQLSTRGGELRCEYLDDRVTISGKCVLYLKGNIYIDS